ncbi:MAG: hypothetical protein FWB90_03925 [Fibromonadales bacterium]|nr:hypothetical protein [Fibromonadales bacterium]
MINLDFDGVCVDFIGTAKTFGIEVTQNDFNVWSWDKISPEEFYRRAELQPWFFKLWDALEESDHEFKFLTKDFPEEKHSLLWRHGIQFPKTDVIGAEKKEIYCRRPYDVLIDDNIDNCKAWSKAGGIAYFFDLAQPDPFADFLSWWNVKADEANFPGSEKC